MRERRQLFALNLALILLLSLLPLPTLAAESLTLESGQFYIGGEVLTPESGVTYTGQGWTFRQSGQNKLTLDGTYRGDPIQTDQNLTIALEGTVVVDGGIFAGYLTLSCNDPAAGLTVTNPDGPAIQASQLKLSFNCGTLTALGTMAMDVATTLTLPDVTGFDEQSPNVIQQAGPSASAAVPVTAYSGEAYYRWSLTECEVVFSPNGAEWPEDTSAYRFLAPYGESCAIVFPAAPDYPGHLFRGWSVLPANGVNFYQPGETVSRTLNRAYYPFYADWAELPTTGVVYYGNGATVDTAPVVTVSGAAGDSVDLTDQGFTAKYNTFTGWSLTPTGTPIESYPLSDGEVLELYAIWTRTQSITWDGNSSSLTCGPLAVDGTVAGLPYDGGSGVGWFGTPFALTLTNDYGGAPLDTSYDLCIHIDGQVTIDGLDGPAIRSGGKVLLDFTDGSSLTVTGGGSSPAIQAAELYVAAPGAMTAVGGSDAPALNISGTYSLSCCADGSAANVILAGSDAAHAAETTYTGQHYLSVSRPVIQLTYDANDGSGRTETISVPLQDPVVLTDAPAFTREGYTLLCWTLEDHADFWQEGDAVPAITDSTTLYAVWGLEHVDYAILDGNGGTCSGAEVILAEGLPSDNAGFIRTGYDFLGWGLTPTSETPLTELPEQDALIRIYALWQPRAVYLHTEAGTETLLPDEEGMVNLPAWTSGFWYTDAFNGWNTAPDGSGTWYARGARIRPAGSMDLYAQGTDLSQDHVWLSACYGAFEGQTFLTIATDLTENTIHFPAVLPVKANMDVTEIDVLAWWWDSSIYTDCGYSPRSAIAPGSTVQNWPSRTLFRGVLDTANTSGEAWVVQDLQGGTTTDGYPLVVSYASLGDLRLIGSSGVFKNGSTLTGWNTEPDGTGTDYEPGFRFLYEGHAFHWDSVPRKLYAMWEDAVTFAVTLDNGGSTTVIPVAEGTSYTLPALTQGDLRFDGWLDADGILHPAGSQLTATADLTLCAQWTEPDLVLTVPEEMQRDGTLYAALYRDGQLLEICTADPAEKLPLYDIPKDAAEWRLFCLDDQYGPLAVFSAGKI